MTNIEDSNNLRLALALRQLLDAGRGLEAKPPYYRLTIQEARWLAGIDRNTSDPRPRWLDPTRELEPAELDALSLEQLRSRRERLLKLMEMSK
jgi:hypothetical protein